jgi:hypothetical protein
VAAAAVPAVDAVEAIRDAETSLAPAVGLAAAPDSARCVLVAGRLVEDAGSELSAQAGAAAIAPPMPSAMAKAPTRPIVTNFVVSNMAARPFFLVVPEFGDPALRRGPGHLFGTIMRSDQQLLLIYRGHNITSSSWSQVPIRVET